MLSRQILRIGVLALLSLAGYGCATTTPSRDTGLESGYGDRVVAEAAAMVGTPYRYGGRTPLGFDCSGLVYYAHRRAGIPVPRTTGAQLRGAQPVALSEVRPGDVLFFKLDGKKVSHVGIYAGEGSFIHAPSTGKNVSYASLNSVFWSSRLTGAGRFQR